ncbi:MATE family efflux transporter [Sphingorhabdus sp. Alg231-15]|uniref:MATE family efflux transporter n=1 Tax=Sphingorhabdus sp. Alg231-15 TaxID=1922222 RepID=UPI000D561366
MTEWQNAIGPIFDRILLIPPNIFIFQDHIIASQTAIFLTGSPMRHITVMTLTASIGLLTMFIVDFVDLLYIAQLGDSALTAAMGFAATILFFGTAFNIGLMIAASALASRKIGQGDVEYARRYLTNILVLSMMLIIPLAVIFFVFAPQILDLAGAKGTTKEAATGYIRIVAPFMPFSVTAMVCSGFLRAHGAARRAMNVTLSMGITNAILDPIFIFGFGLGIDGAAIATACAAIVSSILAVLPIIKHYGGFQTFTSVLFQEDLKPVMAILLPAIMTNVATPVGGFISYRFIASYPDEVIAGFAVLGRVVPVAFCLLFSLSGAVGPIIGQNFGALKFDRIRLTIKQAMGFAFGYTLLIWPLLFLLQGPISDLFNLQGEGRDVFWLFAVYLTPLFFFNGMLFIANAACNNLERPAWSMIMNWLRNTLGILPFLWIGGALYGLPGIVIGPAIGGVLFGVIGYAISRHLVNIQEANHVKR